MVEISIVIPVYNSEFTLKECLDSIVDQTFKDIEIIIINDCSIDNSEAIIQEYMKKDSRIEYIKHEVNKGSLEARRTGVLKAKGKYILAVDSDDWLSLSTCEEIFKKIRTYSPDIIQYSMLKVTHVFQQDNEYKLLDSIQKSLNSTEIFEELFVNHTYVSWNICGKCIKTRLFQEVLTSISINSNMMWSEDYLIMFICTYLATSYTGCEKGIYYYRQTINSSSISNVFSLERYLVNFEIFFPIYKNFKEKHSIDIKYPRINNEDLVLYFILDQFLGHISSSSHFKYFSQICSVFGFERMFDILYQYFPLDYICHLIPNTSTSDKRTMSIKTLGLFTYQMQQGGGTERVVSLLLPIYEKLGYTVILFCEQNSKQDFPIPQAVVSYTIPKVHPFKFISQKIDQHSIDIIISQNYWSELQLYLLFYSKLTNMKILQHYHNQPLAVLYDFVNGEKMLNLYTACHSLAQGVLCLSVRDQIFFQGQDLNVMCMPNPLTFNVNDIQPASLDGDNILFVGRLVSQKNPLFLIRVFAKILQKLPNTSLTICGDGELKNSMIDLARQLDILDNVIFEGNVTNISDYFQKAIVHVMPSLFEGMPMVWGEAKSHGVPTVYTRMDYLDMAYVGGSIAVEQNDIQGFSDAVIALLEDKEYRQKLGKEAKNSLENFTNDKVLKRWQELFTHINSGTLEDSSLMQIDSNLDKKAVLDIYKNDKIKILRHHAYRGYPELSEFHNLFDSDSSHRNEIKIIIRKILVKIINICIPCDTRARKFIKKVSIKIQNLI